jgi:hypothetical protein
MPAAAIFNQTSSKSPPLPEEMAQKGNQPGKFEIRINVMFDYVKSEIVKAAKAPDGQGEQ